MKTNFKRIGKQSISIVLAVMMMLSTMLVGTVTSNAVSAPHFYVVGDPVNSKDWNQKSAIINGNYGSDSVYYIDIKLTNGCYFALHNGSYRYSPNTDGEEIGLNTIRSSNAYNAENKWHYTGDTGTKRIVVDQSASEWYPTVRIENIPSATTHRVTANFRNATVKLGDKTLTSGTAETVDNDKSYTLTVTANSDYSLSKVMQGSTNLGTSGTYTLAAGTDDVTIDITTENNTFDPSNTVYLRMDSNWTSPYGVHIWKNGGQALTNWDKYPKMTYITTDEDGNDIYGYTPEDGKNLSDYDSIIFRAGTKGDNKTGDIKGVPLAGKIYSANDGTWSTYGSTVPTTKYNVTVDPKITNGTVTPSETSLAAGKTFKVTATPEKGYELDTVTVKDESGNPITANADGYYTMPASNVTVSATFKEKTVTYYDVTYTEPTGDGVVSASINPTDATLAEGTNVTVTVKVKDGYTASLDVAGVNVTTSKSGNTYTFTFSMPAQAITVAPNVTKAGGTTGTEIQGLYLIYSNTSNDPHTFTDYTKLYVDSSNQVFAYFTSGKNLDTKKQYYFLISTSYGTDKSYQQAYNDPHTNMNYAFNDEKYNDVVTTGFSEFNTDGTSYYAGTFTVKAGYQDTVSSVKINLGYYNNGKIQETAENTAYAYSYEVIPTSGAEGMVQVFAKDGTIRKQIVNSELVNFQKYADMADTVLENCADLTKYNNENEYYETAYAKVGTKLKIKTTILPAYRDKYFVKAFSINGYSYGIIDASQANKQEGVYTCEYTIPEDFEGKRIEITPIYYYIDDKDTVTFYVEGFDGKVQEMWGNTIAVQAWYKNGVEGGASGSDTKNALGGYPGQPLVYQGGKYSMQIPKCLNDNPDNTVQGITLNNYFWDEIHKQSFTDQSDKYNCQTYDFNDFYKLSETPDVDNIIFDFRYRTTKDNAPSKDGLNRSTYEESELELLKDYSGNIVDIFGNILSEDLAADYENNHLTVISNGYVSITGIGKYATEWSVYDVEGNYITKINCSSLINENNVDPTYTKAYSKLKQYKNLPVMIAYEKSLYGGGDKGTRADGRWYFSKKADTISANVQIQYKEDGSSEFKDDTFVTDSKVGTGTVTGAQAYFRNAGSSGKTTCDGTVDGGNFSVHAQTDANAKYYFLGWYLKTSDGYSFITNESDTDIPMTSNATYVARFIPTPSGTLTLSHTLLTGSADGKTFIKADIIDSEGNVIKPFEETSGNIVIPPSYVNYASEYKIVATLRTEPYGKDEVEGFFNSDQVRYTHVAAGEKTCVVSTTIKELFEEIENTDGSLSHNLKKSNIPFYSNIKSNPLEYTITYTYKTRLNGEQSYVIKDKVSGIELKQMWDENVAAGLTKEQLSKAFIIRKAPFVSNFREVITWNMDAADIKGYTATVSANTSTVDLEISALPVAGTNAGMWTQPATVKYGELAKSNGDYLYKTGTTEFPETFNGYDFSFWAIFDNRDEAKKYSDAVKAYMDNPDPNMSQRLTDLTKPDSYKYLISKSYSKEYNYVSYQNYFIVPVYAGRFAKSEINESQASIRLLEYTRNQWTDDTYGVNGNGTKNEGGSKTDYLYTDFALSFDKNQLLIQTNPYIKVGVTFEVVAKYNKDNDLKNYATESNEKAICNLAKATTPNGYVGTYEKDGASRSVYRYEIENANISVKNRIEYYLRFNNNEKSQQNVMKVYSYIYDTRTDEVFLSDPVYMNMYDIGNLTYITSNLASIDLQPATELG